MSQHGWERFGKKWFFKKITVLPRIHRRNAWFSLGSRISERHITKRGGKIMFYSTMTLHDILKSKGTGYLTISPGATAYAALEVMAEHNVGALLVMDEGKLIGIFSERDYARKVILQGKASHSTTVGELMSSPPICGSPTSSLHDSMVLMTTNHIRHLPIMEMGAIAGVVSLGDVVSLIIRSQEVTIKELENYISGDFPAYAAK